MNIKQEKTIKLICSIVGTITPIISLVYSIIKDSFSWFLFAMVSLLFVIITIVQFVIFKRTNNKLKVYDELLNSDYPLYGIINYLSKKGKIESKNRINDTYQLDMLSLCVKLVNSIEKEKHNDLFLLWSFNGNNIGKEDLSEIYLRIGGDSYTEYSKLNIQASQCNIDNDSFCNNFNKNLLCPSTNERCILNDDKSLKCSPVKEVSSANFNLLCFSLAEPIKPSHMLKMKVSYVWPQCFNPNYDYLLIDPKNFGVGVKCLNITITCDDRIIKKQSHIYLSEINYSVYKKIGKGKFKYNESNNSFEFTLTKVDSNCLYFAEIICN